MISGDIKEFIGNQSQIPMDEIIKVEITGKKWGNRNNLIVSCLYKDIEFVFNTYNNNCYKPRDLGVSFKFDEVVGMTFFCLFSKTKKGYLDIKKAEPILTVRRPDVEDILIGLWGKEEVEPTYHLCVNDIHEESETLESLMGKGFSYKGAEEVFSLIQKHGEIYDCSEYECPIYGDNGGRVIYLNKDLVEAE